MSSIRIATRNSPLALWQANFVEKQLVSLHKDLKVFVKGMTTKGDQMLDRSLSKVGGKGLFLKELEISLLAGETDLAVHSMKDVPVSLPSGLEISTVCERENPLDAFVSNNYSSFEEMPEGSKIGTSSLRRVSQLRHAFPKLKFIELRGNVNTRLAKLDNGEYDAIILAAAGLIRIALPHRIRFCIPPEICLPAVGQGIVGVETRSDDAATKSILAPLHNFESAICLAAERAMNSALDGGCQVPIGGFARLEDGFLKMSGIVAEIDGSVVLKSTGTTDDISIESAEALGRHIAEDLIEQGASELLINAREEQLEPDIISDNPIVVLTRQRQFLGTMPTMLESLDYQPVKIQTLAVKKFVDDATLNLFHSLDQYTDIMFVSRNAVDFSMKLLKEEGLIIPSTVRVLTVGAETAKQLYDNGIDALFPDHGSGAKALLNVEQLSDLKNRKVLVVRGSHGLDWPRTEMQKRGAEVEQAFVYRHVVPDKGRRQFARILELEQPIEGVFLHSARSARNFMVFIGEHLDRFKDARMVVGSERIAEAAISAGWIYEIVIARTPSNKDMMMAFASKQ